MLNRKHKINTVTSENCVAQIFTVELQDK